MSEEERPPIYLPLWCLYDHPKDYPHCFVAREWLIGGDGKRRFGRTIIGQTIDAIRAQIPPECGYWIPRHETDDPVILGSWI